MRKEPASEFFVNGYRCEIKYESRDHYSGWLEGEKIISGHSTSHIRETLISDAKWRVETEPDFWKVCRAVHNFVESQTDRDGEQLWVYRDAVIHQVTPTESVNHAYSALLELENLGLVEKESIVMDSNVDKMFRAVPDADTEIDDTIESPLSEYES